MNLFHQLQMITYKNWNIRKTAKYFEVSIGLVSENLKIAQSINDVKELNSRKEALEKLA